MNRSPAAELYSLIPEAHLDHVLGTLSEFTGLPVSLMDTAGLPIKSYGEQHPFCSLIHRSVPGMSDCGSEYLRAATRAQELGEAYIFSCRANLNLIAYPLLHDSRPLCTVFIGPFLLDQPDSTLISGLAEGRGADAVTLLELYDELQKLTVISPQKATLLMRMTDNLLAPLLPAERALLLKKREKLYQQAKINDTLQHFREDESLSSDSFFDEKEQALLAAVRRGDAPAARALLNDLLGFVFFSKSRDNEAIRTHAMELTVLLSRVAIEGGAHSGTTRELNRKYMLLMEQHLPFDELCALLQEVVDSFSEAVLRPADHDNRHVRKAVQYMAAHYPEKLTLRRVADAAGLSPNYLSTLFRETTGQSFSEYLNRLRAEESKNLLLSTDSTLSEIAIAMGFGDQSHYSRVFRRYCGISPGKFRK